jgi:imidazoleglycerol phosphate dehydratase HisB
MRKSEIERKTKETDIKVSLNIDGQGKSDIKTDIGFFKHMLETFSKHSLIDLEIDIKGDLDVDEHHTIEDTGIVIGAALKKALGEKRGIRRSGFCIYPMDECLVTTAIDLSGRPYLKFFAEFNNYKLGDFPTDLTEDFFAALTNSLEANIHIKVEYGRNDHHKIEAIFKSFAKALRSACEIDERIKNEIPSTKGVI